MRFISNVAGERDGVLSNFLDERLKFTRASSGDDDSCTFLGEEKSCRTADSGAGSSDNRDFVVECWHAPIVRGDGNPTHSAFRF